MIRTGKLKQLKNPFFFLLLIVLILYAVSLLAPLAWGLITSLKSDSDFSGNTFGLPRVWKFSNYADAFRLFRASVKVEGGGEYFVYIEEMFLNSVLYTVGCAVMSTLAPCLVAYIVAKYKFRFLKVIYTVVVVVMIVPIVGNLPSEIQMAKLLGLYDSMLGMWIMKFSFASMYFLVFYAAFQGISWEYAEAAYVDGASNFKVMTRIMLPFVRSTMFVVGLMMFITLWNDYTIPMVYLPSSPTFAYGLFLYCFGGGQGNSTVPMQITGCMIVMVPILIVFVLLKDKIMGNLAIGGIKG